MPSEDVSPVEDFEEEEPNVTLGSYLTTKKTNRSTLSERTSSSPKYGELAKGHYNITRKSRDFSEKQKRSRKVQRVPRKVSVP